MGDIHAPQPVMRILAAFSRDAAALDWAQQQAVAAWGPVVLSSERFDFVETDYYEPTMGPGLKKCFWAFADLADPEGLADWKTATNEWELQYNQQDDSDVPRSLNLDPGYLTLAKLVLASTKDHAHRIYLRDGMYAEVTLHYQRKAWQSHEWTFPDYQRADYQQFFDQCRGTLGRRLKEDSNS